jgi:ATP-dependent DNA helicase RecG
LEQIKANPYISREELAELCGLTSDGIKYNIRKLREKGIIKRVGPDKGGHWEVVED